MSAPDLLEVYRRRVSYGLAVAGSVTLLPFSINNFLQGRVALGIATTTVVALLILNAIAIYKKKRLFIPLIVIFIPSVGGLLLSIHTQGWPGVLWSYPAVLMFHFMLGRRVANVLNGTLVLLVVPMAWTSIEHSMAIRAGVTLALMIMFANIFSIVTSGLYAQVLKEREHAEREARHKSDFLANMSHEIRTPMNAIIGLTHLTLKSELTAKQHRHVSQIQSAATTLLGILNDILDLSKIESGNLQLELAMFELPRVLDTLSSVAALAAREKGVDLVYDVAPDIPLHLIGDRLRIGQILINLTGNAIKFTEQGEVVVTVRRFGTDMIFEVRDTGIGVSPEQSTHLFQAFRQADASTTRRHGGTGLGLAISRQLAEAMGGNLVMASEMGRGSRFTLTVPLGIAPNGPAYGSLLRAREDLARVLAIAGNATSRDVLKAMFAAWGIELEIVESGEDAMWKLARSTKPYDAVIGDAASLEILEDKKGLAMRRMIAIEQPVELAHLAEALAPEGEAETSALAPAPIEIRGRGVLFPEGNCINRDGVRELLTVEGVECDTATNGRDAVLMVLDTATPYDLVLMDVQMPEMDGLQATREIRARIDKTNLPIVALTAQALVEERDRCLAAGMNDYLSKPVEPQDLYAMLRRWSA